MPTKIQWGCCLFKGRLLIHLFIGQPVSFKISHSWWLFPYVTYPGVYAQYYLLYLSSLLLDISHPLNVSHSSPSLSERFRFWLLTEPTIGQMLVRH